jgi:hypothetical protein
MATGKMLGKLAPKYNARTRDFSKYFGTIIPPPPPEKVWREYKIPPDAWQMFGNDTIGDCTCAAIAHMLMLVTVHTGAMVTPTLDDVIKAYTAVSGYDPATGLNDNGAAITDVLDYWRGTGIAGHKILGWAQVDHTNVEQIKQAIWLFGGIDIGVQLPKSAMVQNAASQSWEVVVDDGGIDGGHSIPNFGYGSQGTNCITWGARQGMSWAWFEKYCDEAYAIITQDWFDQTTKNTPSGIDLATLEADLKALSV